VGSVTWTSARDMALSFGVARSAGVVTWVVSVGGGQLDDDVDDVDDVATTLRGPCTRHDGGRPANTLDDDARRAGRRTRRPARRHRTVTALQAIWGLTPPLVSMA